MDCGRGTTARSESPRSCLGTTSVSRCTRRDVPRFPPTGIPSRLSPGRDRGHARHRRSCRWRSIPKGHRQAGDRHRPRHQPLRFRCCLVQRPPIPPCSEGAFPRPGNTQRPGPNRGKSWDLERSLGCNAGRAETHTVDGSLTHVVPRALSVRTQPTYSSAETMRRSMQKLPTKTVACSPTESEPAGTLTMSGGQVSYRDARCHRLALRQWLRGIAGGRLGA